MMPLPYFLKNSITTVDAQHGGNVQQAAKSSSIPTTSYFWNENDVFVAVQVRMTNRDNDVIRNAVTRRGIIHQPIWE